MDVADHAVLTLYRERGYSQHPARSRRSGAVREASARGVGIWLSLDLATRPQRRSRPRCRQPRSYGHSPSSCRRPLPDGALMLQNAKRRYASRTCGRVQGGTRFVLRPHLGEVSELQGAIAISRFRHAHDRAAAPQGHRAQGQAVYASLLIHTLRLRAGGGGRGMVRADRLKSSVPLDPVSWGS